jgi:hypothetical protein
MYSVFSDFDPGYFDALILAWPIWLLAIALAGCGCYWLSREAANRK